MSARLCRKGGGLKEGGLKWLQALIGAYHYPTSEKKESEEARRV